jgi:glycosyltransferase involved in cell wall biosynthesis
MNESVKAKPLRVLQVFQPAVGGVPKYVANLAAGLSGRGWDVVVAGPSRTSVDKMFSDAQVPRVNVEAERSLRLGSDRRAFQSLVELAKDFDLIHAHSSKAGILVAAAGRVVNTPTIYTPHAWSFQRDLPIPVQGGYAAVETVLARLFHRRLILVSDFERIGALRWRVAPATKIDVIRSGIESGDIRRLPSRESARAELGLSEDAFVAAWVGRLDAQKRPQDFAVLQSHVRGRATVVALGFGLAGSCEARALISSGGVMAPEGTDPSVVYAAADAFVMTSAWEALPIAVLEAMHAGLPVASYRVGDLEHQVQDGVTGLLVKPKDVHALARAVETLAQDRRESRIMGERAQKHVAQFSYSAMIDQIEAVYRTVVSTEKR